jgi:uncharacterized protein YqgC (DUF456 family)
VELVVQNRTSEEALKTAVGTLLAFAGSLFAKAFMQLAMIVVFLADI